MDEVVFLLWISLVIFSDESVPGERMLRDFLDTSMIFEFDDSWEEEVAPYFLSPKIGANFP